MTPGTRDTVQDRSLADLQAPDCFVNLVRGQRHVNRLNNCRDQRIGYGLKLSPQIVCKGFGLLGV